MRKIFLMMVGVNAVVSKGIGEKYKQWANQKHQYKKNDSFAPQRRCVDFLSDLIKGRDQESLKSIIKGEYFPLAKKTDPALKKRLERELSFFLKTHEKFSFDSLDPKNPHQKAIQNIEESVKKNKELKGWLREKAETKNGGIGYKAANLFKLKELCEKFQSLHGFSFVVPNFLPVPSKAMIDLLKLQETKADFKNALNQSLNQNQNIVDRIEGLSNFLQNCQGKIMVRSTGIEDNEEIANAGGNTTVANVDPNDKKAVYDAIFQVLLSYYGDKSLAQQELAQDVKKEQKLFLPILFQEMAGESADNANPENIPSSGVMFTQDRESYIEGDAPSGITKISSTFGHCEAVVNANGRVAIDEFIIDPSDIIVPMLSKKKKRRLRGDKGGDLILRENPKELYGKASLTKQEVLALKEFGDYLEKDYGYPVDVEFSKIGKTFHIVQARPIVHKKTDKKPSYLKKEDTKESNECFKGVVILSAHKSVMPNLKTENIIFKKTLKEAADHYLKLGNKSNIQCVIIEEMAATTSHEATVMSSANMPVIRLGKKMNDVQESDFLTISPQQGIVICHDQQKDFETVPGVASYALGEISKDLMWLDIEKESKDLAPKKIKRKLSEDFKNLDAELNHFSKETPEKKNESEDQTKLLQYFRRIQEVNPNNPSCLLRKSIETALFDGSKVQVMEGLASYAQNDNVKTAWDNVNRVLKTLESEKQKLFQDMISNLVEMNIFAPWLNTAFYESAKQKTQYVQLKEAIEQLLQNYNHNHAQIQNIKQLTEEIDVSSKDLFSDPKKFDKNYQIFETLIKNYETHVKNNFSEKKTSLIVKLLSIEYLNKLVDFVDINIKSLTGSPHYNEKNKIDNFYKLLLLNKDLFVMLFGEKELKPKTIENGFEPFGSLLSELGMAQNQSDTLTVKRTTNGVMEYFLQKCKSHKNTLMPTKDFLVQEWCFSGQGMPDTIPQTLEDMFTLMHQNLIDQIQILNSVHVKDFLQKNTTLKDFEQALHNFVSLKKGHILTTINTKQRFFEPNLRACDISGKKISLIYNIPLYTHSGTMIFESGEKNSTLKISLFGTFGNKNAKARWGKIQEFVVKQEQNNKIKLSKIKSTTSEVVVEWKIPNKLCKKNNVDDILETIFTMCEMTFGYQ